MLNFNNNFMKNLLILTFIFSIVFLASCSQQENIENTTNTNLEQNLQSEIQTEIENENEEIINTGTIQEEQVKEVKKTKSIALENFNVVLKEDWKTINKLTTRATGQKECDWDAGDEWTKTIYNYKIIADNWNYGIVKREKEICWIPFLHKTYFSIDLENDTELTEILEMPYDVKEKVENNILKFIILEPQFIVENEADLDRSTILASDLKNDWFKKEWNDWVKTIDLKNIIKPEIKKEEKVEIQKIEEPKLDGKYSDENLKKNWYKLNNLWNIKEYYKEDLIPEKTDTDGMLISRWYSSWKTIYVEWNKVLDFEVNYDWWQSLIIWNDVVDLTQFEWSPIQAIFWWNGPKIIISDINTIKLVDKENGINKIIWSR